MNALTAMAVAGGHSRVCAGGAVRTRSMGPITPRWVGVPPKGVATHRIVEAALKLPPRKIPETPGPFLCLIQY